MNTTQKTIDKNRDLLKAKLRELFQLDRGDLDFGLYRIMAHKREVIKTFLDERLLPVVTEALGDIADKQLRRQSEADAYNHLHQFFSRYYKEGDFISLRRYKSHGNEAYAIPYNGEEVKLHWANSDQYYIKTTENYASYIFLVDKGNGKARVRFEIARADNEKDHIKEDNGKKRMFVLAKNFIEVVGDDLVIRFEHRPLTASEKAAHPKNGQETINADTESRIRKMLDKKHKEWCIPLCKSCPTKCDKDRTLLRKHIDAYAAKNSFDYFIHKDLGGFLRRELDYYLKSEVLSVEDLELTSRNDALEISLAQMRAINAIGKKIIDFLAQLEDFQKQLWLKKKFVLETQYCITLDKVPTSFYDKIITNKAQVAEWVELFAIDELESFRKKLTPDFLKANPFLVLDTQHFDKADTDELLAAISNDAPLDAQMNGLLVHGENFQALNLLQAQYRESVDCVYIDPPYNTKMSPIIYKNDYKHSSWLSLIADRVRLLWGCLNSVGVLSVAIDDEELYRLKMTLDNVLGGHYIGTVVIQSNPGGRDINSHFAVSHDYGVFYAKEGRGAMSLAREDTDEKINPFRRTGGLSSPSERPNSEYAFYFSPDSLAIVGVGGARTNPHPAEYAPLSVHCFDKSGNLVEKSCDDFFKENKNVKTILPVFSNGDRGVWRWSKRTKVCQAVKNGDVFARVNNRGDVTVELKSQPEDFYKPKTIWHRGKDGDDGRFSATTYGTILLQDIMGTKGDFSYPKSIYTVTTSIASATYGNEDAVVLDCFAGSGTTGHAVIKLNREDEGDRKYVLVELGKHFDAVLLPRIKKVIYSADWKDGKPKNRVGVSQLVKYIRLESYEDTLDNLTMAETNEVMRQAEHRKIAEEYLLRYSLGEETTKNATLLGNDFDKPHDYTLQMVREGVRCDRRADLAETFNFLLGLQVARRQVLDGVLAISGKTADGDNALVLWRDLAKPDVKKLNKWFTKHRENFGGELDKIYVNGDHILNSLQQEGDKWNAEMIEPVFRALMFEGGE